VRLPAYLDERFTPPAPSIYSQIETKAIFGRQNLSFLIDTGASATTILDPDLKRLGIDWNSLTKAPRPLGGIGGTVETRLINDGRLFFRTGSGETVAEKLTIYAAKHDPRPTGQTRQATRHATSLPTRKRHPPKIQIRIRQTPPTSLPREMNPLQNKSIRF
jgi:hypothetical protein